MADQQRTIDTEDMSDYESAHPGDREVSAQDMGFHFEPVPLVPCGGSHGQDPRGARGHARSTVQLNGTYCLYARRYYSKRHCPSLSDIIEEDETPAQTTGDLHDTGMAPGGESLPVDSSDSESTVGTSANDAPYGPVVGHGLRHPYHARALASVRKVLAKLHPDARKIARHRQIALDRLEGR